jgi:hypothetical protein
VAAVRGGLRLRSQHRRDVHAIDGGRTPLPEPDPDPPGAARQIEDGLPGRPVDRLQSVEQAQVHLVLHGLLVGAHPFSVAVAHVHDRIAALVVQRMVHASPLVIMPLVVREYESQANGAERSHPMLEARLPDPPCVRVHRPPHRGSRPFRCVCSTAAPEERGGRSGEAHPIAGASPDLAVGCCPPNPSGGRPLRCTIRGEGSDPARPVEPPFGSAA